MLAVRDETSRAEFGRIRFKEISSSGLLCASSPGFGYFAGANARSANAKMLVNATHNGANALQVRVPAAAAGVVRVADHVAVLRPFAAEITLQCHISSYKISFCKSRPFIVTEMVIEGNPRH